jgi:sporulation protein YlmC with PRC-barrel domain
MRFKELIGREIVDASGQTIGYVEEIDLSEKGKVNEIIGLPKGVVDQVTRNKLHVKLEDVEAFGDIILLKKKLESL